MAARGRFIPNHPEKYLGDSNKIFFRSTWEISVMKFFDSRNDIVKWNSEEIQIPYISPVDNQVHMYYPDFYIEYYDINNVLQKEIVEVKPRHEADIKYAKSDRSKQAFLVNDAKWKSASLFCESRGMLFRVITEFSIFRQVEKKRKNAKL